MVPQLPRPPGCAAAQHGGALLRPEVVHLILKHPGVLIGYPSAALAAVAVPTPLGGCPGAAPTCQISMAALLAIVVVVLEGRHGGEHDLGIHSICHCFYRAMVC